MQHCWLAKKSFVNTAMLHFMFLLDRCCTVCVCIAAIMDSDRVRTECVTMTLRYRNCTMINVPIATPKPPKQVLFSYAEKENCNEN